MHSQTHLEIIFNQVLGQAVPPSSWHINHHGGHEAGLAGGITCSAGEQVSISSLCLCFATSVLCNHLWSVYLLWPCRSSLGLWASPSTCQLKKLNKNGLFGCGSGMNILFVIPGGNKGIRNYIRKHSLHFLLKPLSCQRQHHSPCLQLCFPPSTTLSEYLRFTLDPQLH